MNTRAQGSIAEAEACRYIESLGMLPLCQNYKRFTGEIDLIAKDKHTLVFIEVKSRSSVRKGMPADAVDKAKQKRIIQTALMYIKENRIKDAKMRFDVISFLDGEIKYIPSAFDASAY